MEKIGAGVANGPMNARFDYQQLVKTIVEDPDVAAFIQKEGLDAAEIERSMSKFHEYIHERDKWQAGNPAYIAKGYKPILVRNQGYADVSYEETEELVTALREASIKNRMNFINLPASLKAASLEQVNLDDERRLPAFASLATFAAEYPKAKRGIYLYGDFGVGKSYMMAALAHELAEKKGVSTTLVHYPSLVVDMKNAIQTGTVKEELDKIKSSPVLMIDDIGAEQNSPWVRDDVLQVLLQHRMQEDLPTFFTSNFSFADLERHFAAGKSGDETWQAKRIMERIRYLAKEVHLEGVNRRHE